MEKCLTKSEMETLLNTLQNDKKNPYSLDYWNDNDKTNPYEWSVTFIAPKDCIYSGGFFLVKIVFPFDYPNHKPTFFFRTKIYHLNINSLNGEVCCTMPKTNKVRDYLDAVFLMFYFQNEKSAYNFSSIYKSNREEFEKNAKEWVRKYATIDNYEDSKPDLFI